MFTKLLIETRSYCTRRCRWCVNGYEQRTDVYMSRHLVRSILGQLRGVAFAGNIGFMWYSEPLTDRRLPVIVAMTRDACPRANLNIDTNGDLLTVPLTRRLFDAGLTEMRVMQYDGAIARNVAEVLDARPYGGHVSVRIVRDYAALRNPRGGVVRHLIPAKPQTGRCRRVQEQLVVAADGRVPLCCNDPHATYCLGNANDAPLAAIWFSEKAADARSRLACGDRGINICSVCTNRDTE